MQLIQLLKVLCATASLGFLWVLPGGTAPQLEPGTVQDIAIPYYAKGQPAPAAVVRIKRLFTDYQRRGFFRIGLLPTLVADEVKIEVSQPEQVLAALQGAERWLKPLRTKKALEWRKVQFVFSESKEARLEAKRMTCADNGAWHLREGVTLRSGTNETRKATAILQVTGGNAGELILDETASENLNLLRLFTDNNIRQ